MMGLNLFLCLIHAGNSILLVLSTLTKLLWYCCHCHQNQYYPVIHKNAWLELVVSFWCKNCKRTSSRRQPRRLLSFLLARDGARNLFFYFGFLFLRMHHASIADKRRSKTSSCWMMLKVITTVILPLANNTVVVIQTLLLLAELTTISWSCFVAVAYLLAYLALAESITVKITLPMHQSKNIRWGKLTIIKNYCWWSRESKEKVAWFFATTTSTS